MNRIAPKSPLRKGGLKNGWPQGGHVIIIQLAGPGREEQDSHLLRVFAIREGYLIQRGVSAKADAGTGAALLRVPEIAALLHAGADVGEGADGGVVIFHHYFHWLRSF